MKSPSTEEIKLYASRILTYLQHAKEFTEARPPIDDELGLAKTIYNDFRSRLEEERDSLLGITRKIVAALPEGHEGKTHGRILIVGLEKSLEIPPPPAAN